MTKNILHNIEKNMSSFSKGQKLIARFILENYDKAAFMTASKLGKTVQVSEFDPSCALPPSSATRGIRACSVHCRR